jgi:hypothetical protein
LFVSRGSHPRFQKGESIPLKVNVGLSKKIGLPHYGSLGASCHVEVELDSTLLFADLDGFQEKVKRAYLACHQAVNDEIQRQQETGSLNGALAPANGNSDHVRDDRHAGNGNGAEANGNPARNGASGRSESGAYGPSRASSKQLSYARQLAGKIQGLGYRGLENLVGTMFGKPLADLSSFEASSLIDTLKQVVAGSIDLASLEAGAAT